VHIHSFALFHFRKENFLRFECSFGIVAPLNIRPEEAGEKNFLAAGFKIGTGIIFLSGYGYVGKFQLCLCHLCGDGSFPDQVIQFELPP